MEKLVITKAEMEQCPYDPEWLVMERLEELEVIKFVPALLFKKNRKPEVNKDYKVLKSFEIETDLMGMTVTVTGRIGLLQRLQGMKAALVGIFYQRVSVEVMIPAHLGVAWKRPDSFYAGCVLMPFNLLIRIPRQIFFWIKMGRFVF